VATAVVVTVEWQHQPTSGVAVRNCLKERACYAPQQFRVAYGIAPLLDRGIDGRGETVVLLEQEETQAAPPKVTDIRQDLARFDGLFGLPEARLQVVNSLARSPSPWLADEEEVEDTEIVHAVAPAADIRELLVSDADLESTAATVNYGLAALLLGVTQGAVISVSSSKGESCFTPAEIAGQNATLQMARERHVTVVISSGDFGVVSQPCPGAAVGAVPVTGVNLLASDPLALAAGGTSLRASYTTGTYIGETAWSRPADPPAVPESQGSGGGFSYAGRHLGFVNPALYRIGRSSLYGRAFHEVTTGTNTVVFPGQTFTGYRAGPGWNPVTGWGSPDAAELVPLLVRYAGS
jgi:subtilase family serine protease